LEDRIEFVKTILKKLRDTVSKERLKQLDLDKCERAVEKLSIFSESCEECQYYLLELEEYFIQLEANQDETDFKQHKQFIYGITSHLQKNHKLLPEGYYLSIFMSLGMSIGVVFGLTIFENIGIGIAIGMCTGLAIGAGLDADANKKGKTI